MQTGRGGGEQQEEEEKISGNTTADDEADEEVLCSCPPPRTFPASAGFTRFSGGEGRANEERGEDRRGAEDKAAAEGGEGRLRDVEEAKLNEEDEEARQAAG